MQPVRYKNGRKEEEKWDANKSTKINNEKQEETSKQNNHQSSF
jgi:hypothetical protein